MISKNISYSFISKILKNFYTPSRPHTHTHLNKKYNLSIKKDIQFDKKDEINLYEYFKLPVKERNNYKMF